MSPSSNQESHKIQHIYYNIYFFLNTHYPPVTTNYPVDPVDPVNTKLQHPLMNSIIDYRSNLSTRNTIFLSKHVLLSDHFFTNSTCDVNISTDLWLNVHISLGRSPA